jgi:NAD(P)-dependent dehydrogenase (short-subunit alcohol dehydrogenase family)
MAKLNGQMALVTGASGGIGRCIALELAREGATLFLVGRNTERLQQTALLCQSFCNDIKPAICDLTDSGALNCVLTALPERLDILIHCAGAIGHGMIEESPPSLLHDQFAANVIGPLALTRGVLPLLKKPKGQIVFVNSSSGLSSAPNRGYFSATQHALKALTDTLRQEVNRDNVRVTSVYPGRTATPRTEALFAREGRPYETDLLLQPEDGCRGRSPTTRFVRSRKATETPPHDCTRYALFDALTDCRIALRNQVL